MFHLLFHKTLGSDHASNSGELQSKHLTVTSYALVETSTITKITEDGYFAILGVPPEDYLAGRIRPNVMEAIVEVAWAPFNQLEPYSRGIVIYAFPDVDVLYGSILEHVVMMHHDHVSTTQ